MIEYEDFETVPTFDKDKDIDFKTISDEDLEAFIIKHNLKITSYTPDFENLRGMLDEDQDLTLSNS